jgi:hypothetical protein
MIQAIVLLRSEGKRQLALPEAHDVLATRSRQLAERGLVEPEPTPPDGPQLVERVRTLPDRVVAIEARWDGDTTGWFVELVAVVERPGPHHDRFDAVPLRPYRHGSDLRLFNDVVPPWPEAAEASEHGRAVAGALGVPFHFASPEHPDDQAPRWWSATTEE